jgi:NAD(P)H-hydrate repair Nnr-like enzyme with NAD(P)H-hydrate dehydratase domain
MDTFWQKQEHSKPLFEDLIWNKPEQKSQAGTLLIIGGNSHEIIHPSQAFAASLKTGVGECRVLLPSATKKLLGPKYPHEIILLTSNPSGGFSKLAFNEIAAHDSWAGATLYAGSLGKNSETSALVEDLVLSLSGLVTLSDDAIDIFLPSPQKLLERSDTLLVCNFVQLQKIIQHHLPEYAITSTMGVVHFAETVAAWTKKHNTHIVCYFEESFFVCSQGKVISTKMATDTNWQTEIAAAATVWWLQNPSRPLEAIATSFTEV